MRTRTISSQSLLGSAHHRDTLRVEGFHASPARRTPASPRFFWFCALFLGVQAGLILSRLLSQLPR